jgi:hypothetical protein
MSISVNLYVFISNSHFFCISTEKSYIMDMVLLVTHYQRPTQSYRILPDDLVNTVFLNSEALLEVHTGERVLE